MSVHEVFSSMGEDGFRRIESMCLKELALSPGPLVVALGGGTLLLPENLETVLSRGVLVTLALETSELLKRFTSSRGRPLAPEPKALEGLLKARTEHYAGLPGRMDTRGKTPEDVAAAIAELPGFLPKLR